jgi:hypothetical protein
MPFSVVKPCYDLGAVGSISSLVCSLAEHAAAEGRWGTIEAPAHFLAERLMAGGRTE